MLISSMLTLLRSKGSRISFLMTGVGSLGEDSPGDGGTLDELRNIVIDNKEHTE